MKKTLDITGGKLFPAILLYVFPVFLTSMVNTLYSAADMLVVSYFSNALALAAIGAVTPIINLLVYCLPALCNGTSVVVGRAIGAQDSEKAHKGMHSALIFGAALGVGIAVLIWLLSQKVLLAINCPAECFSVADLYLKLYCLGLPAKLVYFCVTSVLYAEGDSKTPMFYETVCGVFNVLLNIMLCLVLANKVAAVALATVASYYLSAFLGIRKLIIKKEGMCRLKIRSMRFSLKTQWEMLKYGIPQAVTSALYPIANLQIQPAINSYGAICLAGATAASQIDALTTTFAYAFNTTCVTFVSQNIGAHKPKRVRNAIGICLGCSILCALVCGLLTYRFSQPLLNLYVDGNAESIWFGQKRMQYLTCFLWLSAYNGGITVILQSLGYPTFPTINNLISVLGFRIIWMRFFYYPAPSADMLFVCYPISYGLMALLTTALFIYAAIKYQKKEKQFRLTTI